MLDSTGNRTFSSSASGTVICRYLDRSQLLTSRQGYGSRDSIFTKQIHMFNTLFYMASKDKGQVVEYDADFLLSTGVHGNEESI